MKHLFSTIAVAVALMACNPSAGAETTPEKTADIKKLMELTGSADMAEQVMTQMISIFKQGNSGVSDEFWTDFMAEIDMNEMIELCIPSYEKHFTHEEIKELIAFYETPIGEKMIQVQPMIMQECMVAGQQWGQQLAVKVSQKMQAYKAEQE